MKCISITFSGGICIASNTVSDHTVARLRRVHLVKFCIKIIFQKQKQFKHQQIFLPSMCWDLAWAYNSRSTEIILSSRHISPRPTASKIRLGRYKSCWWLPRKIKTSLFTGPKLITTESKFSSISNLLSSAKTPPFSYLKKNLSRISFFQMMNQPYKILPRQLFLQTPSSSK